ncbi:MAG: transcription elongation factor GreA [Chloroflexi bacterium]|nr:MAG: transcription elongation factor GreA [Chloroflexota bacterium]
MLMEQVEESVFITPKGIIKIEAEISRLRNTKRPEVVERLRDSMTGGDQIDNTEYITTQDELAFVDGRIQDLTHILRNAELIQPGEIDGIIRLGSTVIIQEKGADLETYTLVGPTEADPSEGLISNKSPLGCALINHTIGDDVEINAPDGVMRFRIIAVS